MIPASPELHSLWGSVPDASHDFVNVLCLLQGFFLFLIKPDICFNAGWCGDTVHVLPTYCVWEQKTETVRCGVVSAAEVLYSVSYGLVCSPSCSGFPCHPQDLSVPAGEKEAVGDRLCPSLPGLAVTFSERSPTAEWLVGVAWAGLWLLGGGSRRSGSMEEGVTPDPCGAIVPLWRPPGTGPGHLITLDTSGSVGLITAEGERSSSPETPPILYPEGLIILLQCLVMLWCLFTNHCCEWPSDVVW